MATTVLGLKTFTASDPVDYNEINDNYMKIDNGVKTALQGRAAHNLMDNSNFQINQRGVTSIVDNWKYIVDRWVCTNVSSDAPISVNANGIILNNAAGTQTQGFRQYISIKDGAYTVAAKTDSSIWIRTFTYSNKTITNTSSSSDGKGQIYVAVSDDNIYIAIQAFAGYSIKVEWAALYEGTYTADTLPAYQPKGYAAELAECMRYYIKYTSDSTIPMAVATKVSNTVCRATIMIATTMRTKYPTINASGCNISGVEITSIDSAGIVGNGILLTLNCDASSLTYNTTYCLAVNSGGYIEISADL